MEKDKESEEEKVKTLMDCTYCSMELPTVQGSDPERSGQATTKGEQNSLCS